MPVVVVVNRLKNFDEWLRCSRPTLHQKLAVGDCYAEVTIETEFALSGEVKASEAKRGPYGIGLSRNTCKTCLSVLTRCPRHRSNSSGLKS